MPVPGLYQITPACVAPPELRLTVNGLIGDRIAANESNWLIPAPASNPGMIEIFSQRQNLHDNPVPWAGEFAGKYLVSAVQSLILTANPVLNRVVSQFVTQLIATQGADGSLGLPLPWDLWGQYHVILGLLRWYALTDDENALASCERAADLACVRYLNRVSAIASDDPADAEKNQTIAHALLKLYAFTGQSRYCELALDIASDWASPAGFNPILEHALGGGEFYSGSRPRWENLHNIQAMAELYFITGQPMYRQAFEKVWNSIRQFDRHASGGFTSGEAATGDPFDPRYIETCGTVAWMALSIDMLRITADATVADELELSLFNAILGAQSRDGRLWTYHTPMGGIPIDNAPPPADRVGYRLPAYYDLGWQARDRYSQLSCCATNGPRGIGCLAEWAIMRSADAIIVNFYGPLTAVLTSPPGPALTLTQQTDYPASGAVMITVEVSSSALFTIQLRIPAWSRNSKVAVNGIPVSCQRGAYCSVTREWNTGDTIALVLDMAIRVSKGAAAAQDLAALYHGPLLLALDTADTAFDPSNPPKIDLASSPEIAAQSDGSLRASFPSPQGLLTLRDFASAGRSAEGFLTGRPESGVVWQFSRSDQSMIAEQMMLLPNGGIQGYTHPNESSWGYDGDFLTFFAQNGAPSTRFTLRLEQHGKQVLSGFSLLDPSVRHLLSQVDFAIVGKTWQFRRLTQSGEVTLLPVVRLLDGGGFDIPTNPNESRWDMEGSTLVFYAANGAPSTRFTSIRMRNGRTEWRGEFLFDSTITHELLEIDLDLPSMIWRFFRQGEADVIADKVRLLPNQGIDGYRHPNEARWEPAGQPGEFLFRSASGAVSTIFDTIGVNQGTMIFSGTFLFNPTITHVLQEVAPGWQFDSTYVSWLPI
jgi:DUF1680 family protein